tara:strand:+ start:2015 stop:2179 length:165 start_codon:yes stop_codon:yes gene_type:complete
MEMWTWLKKNTDNIVVIKIITLFTNIYSAYPRISEAVDMRSGSFVLRLSFPGFV